MPDDNAQDTGQVAQPQPTDIPEVTVTASRQFPKPTKEDLDWLNEKPERWPHFEDSFGSLPKDWSATNPAKPTPTQDDLDWLKADPKRADAFKSSFGDLPKGWGQPQSSWGDVAKSAQTNIGAGIERIGAGAQEAVGSGEYESAQKQYWQAMILPEAVRNAKAKNIALFDDPLVLDTARHLLGPGKHSDADIRAKAQDFTKDWPTYANMPQDKLQDFVSAQREKMEEGATSREKGAERRRVAGETEQAFAPLNPSKLQQFTVDSAAIAPELLGGFAVSMIPGGAVPAAAMLTSDFGLRAYSQGRDAGLNDQQSKLYGILSGLATAVPNVPLSMALSKAPGANLLLGKGLQQVIVGGIGRQAGRALDQGVAMTVMNALQMGIDKGILDKDMNLSDALHELGKGFLSGTLIGGVAGAAHEGVQRVAHGPRTPADIEDAQAHAEIVKGDQEKKQADAEDKAKLSAESAENAPPANPVQDANAAALRALMQGEQIKPEIMTTLQQQGLVTVGKKTGKPLVLPAGKRMLADSESQRNQTPTGDDKRPPLRQGGEQSGYWGTAEIPGGDKSNALPADKAGGTPAGAGGEEPDVAAAGKAPRTPVEAEDAVGAETRRSQAFEQVEAPDKSAREADVERAYGDRQRGTERAKGADYTEAKNQVAEQTLEQAPHATGDTPMVTMKGAMEATQQRAADVAATIPRMPGLSPEGRQIESNFINKIANNVNAVIDEYSRDPESMGGKIVSADIARHLSEDIKTDPTLTQEVHEPSSWLANVLYKRALAQPPKPGEDNLVVLTSGAPASGKSSTLERAGPLTRRAQVIFDAVMSTPESGLDKVDSAIKAGKWVSQVYVYQNPREAFKDSLLRAAENDRAVPAAFQKSAHEGSPKAVRAILDKYADDPRVQIIGIDNSLGDGKAAVADINELLKKPSKITMGEMRSIAKELLNEGRITPEIYERTLEEPAPARGADQDAGRRDGEHAQPEHQRLAGGEAPSKDQPALSDAEKAKLARAESRARRRVADERTKTELASASEAEKAGPYTSLAEAIPARDWNEWTGRATHDNGRVASKNFLDQVSRSASDPRLKALAIALHNYAPDTTIEFTDHVVERTGKEVRGAGGLFTPETNRIQVGRWQDRSQMAKAALHELTHASVYHEIERNPQGPLATNLRELLEEARQLAGKRYGTNLVFEHIAHFTNLGIKPETFVRELYGLTNVHEFVAEAMSNENFQALLDEITPASRFNRGMKPTGLFRKFVQIVRDFFSTSGTGINSSLLEDVIATTGEVMKAQAMRYNAPPEVVRALSLQSKAETERREPKEGDVTKRAMGHVHKFDASGNILANPTIGEGAGKVEGHTHTYAPGESRTSTEEGHSHLVGPFKVEIGADVARDVMDNRMSKLVTSAAELGALKMARGISRFADWSDTMTQELGAGIRPALDQLYQLAKDKVVDVKSMLYKTTKTGQLVGGPQGAGKADLTPMRAQLRRLAREGEFGKDWYKESSDALLQATDGNRAEARRLAGVMAITSAGASVDANTTMGLRAWYQHKAGEPIHVGTTEIDASLQQWLDKGVEPEGMKRSNFYGNLLQSLGGDDQRMYTGGATVDRWMMRALGYTREAPSDAQYAFVSNEVQRLAKQLKWTTEQAQAAIWISIKARWEAVRGDVRPIALKKGWIEKAPVARGGLKINDPERYYGAMLDAALKTTIGKAQIERAATNFRDSLLKHRAQVSWEAMPGVGSGRLRGADKLPLEALAAFQADVSAAHTNPKTGNDALREALGLLAQGRINGNSAWFRDPGQVMRFRHWGAADLTTLDPAKQGTGAAGQITERNRTNRVTSLYPYDLNTGQPEPQVSAGKSQYVVEVPAAQLYDATRDPRGYRQAAQEPISFTGEGEPTAHAYDHDAFETMVKDAGFKGYYISESDDQLMKGQARLFEPWPATPADKYVNYTPELDAYVKAGAQDVLYAPLEQGAAQKAGAPLDPNARAIMESYASALGKINNQDSVGWHRPRFGVTQREGNGIDVKLSGANADDFMRAYKAVFDAVRATGVSDERAAEFAPIQTPDGMRFVNWGVLENRQFQQIVQGALGQTFGMRNPNITHFAADGGLIHARDYDSIIAGNGHDKLLAGPIADVGRRVEASYRDFAQRHGLQDTSSTSAERVGQKVEASSPIPLDRLTSYPEVAGRFGKVGQAPAEKFSGAFQLYKFDPTTVVPKAIELAKSLGFDIQYFSFESDPSKGVEFRLPRFGTSGYDAGQLWVYDPRTIVGTPHDVEYTRAWRITHELGHALTEQFMQNRYGDSRRYGRMGIETMVQRGVLGKQVEVPTRGMTLSEAQRAVEWEDVAARGQRMIMEKLGVPIPDADWARETNIGMSDAMFRAVSGDFGDPVGWNFEPNSQPANVKDVLTSLHGTEGLLARSQGREPTQGMDLDSWRAVTDDEIRQSIEAKESGNKDIKFSVRPADTTDYRVVAKDRDGNEVAGPHSELQFSNKEDAVDHITAAAEGRAQDIGGETDHNEGWSTTKKAGKIDRTYSVEPVSRDPYKNQLAAGKGAPGAAGRFLKELADHYPENMVGERLINGHVSVGIVNDPINQDTAYISYVRSVVPGNGEGTRAMRDLAGLADKHGTTLELNAVPLDAKGIPNEKLIDWYKKLGFKEIGEPGEAASGANSQFMRREPQPGSDPVPVYQTNAGKGISAEDAAKVIDYAKRMFPQAQHHLITSIEDAPHDVQAIAETRGVTDRVAAVYVRDYDGTHTYLVQNNALSVADAISDMLHENVGHDGIAKTFGPRVGNLMDGFLRNTKLRNVIERVADLEGINLKGAKDAVERREAWRAAAEEWVAHIAGSELRGADNTGPAKFALTSLVSEMKVWAASHGLPIALNQKDALTALTRAHRYVSTGSWVDRITEAREAAERDRVKFSVVPKSGNPDLDELLNDKIGAAKIGWRTRLSAAMTDIRSRLVTSGLDRMNRVKEYETDLKVPPAESGYISMRLSTNVAPLLRNLIEFGHLKWTGTVGFDPDKSMTPDYMEGKPLNRVLAPLQNDHAMLRRFEGYMVALRSRGLMAEGRENHLEQRHIQAGLDLSSQYPHFVQMQREIAALNRNVLDFGEKAGVIDPEARKMWESDYYVPFYRVTDDAGGGPWSAGSLAKVRNPIMRLMGGKENLNDITGNIVRNWSTLINASIKAHAVRTAVDNLAAAGVAVRVPALERSGDALVSTSAINKLLASHGITGSLSASSVGAIQKLMSLSAPQGDDVVQVWRGGKREYYRLADPSLAVAFSSLKGSPLRSLRDDPIGRWVVGAATMPKMVLTKLTTENPAFGIRTLWKDNINAWTVGRGAMPVTPVVSAITGLARTMSADGAFKRMAAAGATFNAGRADPYDTNLTAKRYVTAPSLVGRLWDGYRNMMLSGENASRVTIYDRTLKETDSHKLAAFEARDLMDYAMRGSSPIVQFLVETVPFWGAHVQGLYKTVRAMNPESSLTYTQIAGQAAKKIAPLVLKGTILSMLASTLYMHNRQNSAYNDLPDIQKELYYHIYFGNYHITIPKAFESGTIFGTIPEAITEAAMSRFDPQTMKEQSAYLMHAFGAALNLYPRVTAVTPLYELQVNKDLASGFPILSEHDQGVMPQEQAGPGTSPTVAGAARAMPGWAPNALKSPKEFQHLIQGYFGIMGSYALNAADFMYRKANGMPAAPTRNLNEIPVVGSFVKRSDEPAKSTKSLGELSTVMIAANQLHKTITDLQKAGDDASLSRAKQLAQENQDLMIANAGMKPASDAVHELQNLKRQIQQTPNMTAEQKQAKVNEVQKKINEIAQGAYEWRPGGKLNRGVLKRITSDVTPAEKAKILRQNDMPALASIALQYGKALPPRVQAAIEELG